VRLFFLAKMKKRRERFVSDDAFQPQTRCVDFHFWCCAIKPPYLALATMTKFPRRQPRSGKKLLTAWKNSPLKAGGFQKAPLILGRHTLLKNGFDKSFLCHFFGHTRISPVQLSGVAFVRSYYDNQA